MFSWQIGPSSLLDQLPPSNLLLPTQPSQSSLLQQQMQQIQQQQPFANSSQATISSTQQQQAESQSPYHRVGGPSSCNNPLVSSGGDVKVEVKDVAGDREAVLTEEEEKMEAEEAKDK